MDIPIRLKFFKKLELYQELKRQDRKARRTGRRAWDIEKAILKWTAEKHHHLGSPLLSKYIKENILKALDFNGDDMSELEPAMSNLVFKGFAIQEKGAIKISLEGLYMGEVISECEHKILKWKYPFLIGLTWLTIFAASLIVIFEAIQKLYKIISFLIL